MTLKKANELKKILEKKTSLTINKVKSIYGQSSWNLEVFEIEIYTKEISNKRSPSLIRYDFIIALCKEHQCGMFIEASNNIPSYLLY